jgi:glutaredoxin
MTRASDRLLNRPWQAIPWALGLTFAGLIATAGPAQAAESNSGNATSGASQPSSNRQQALARHLKQKGAVVYGAWWCPHCTQQKELFGLEAIELLPYVECDKDDAGRKQCQQAQVRGYPTWELNGERRLGVLSLEELEIWSGYRTGSGANR